MESVLWQDWPDVEYLVVDPGSTDNTPEVIQTLQQKYPGRIIHITERDNGPADGLNRAFAQATGDLLGYLNGDDVYLPGCFRSAVAAAEKHPNAAVIYADGYISDSNGRIVKRVISTVFSAKLLVTGGALMLQQSTFYRADAFRAVGGFNALNKTNWDGEILADISLRKMQFVHVNGYWSVFRIHKESITGSQRLIEESRRNSERVFQKVMGRPTSRADRAFRRLVYGYMCLTHPRATFFRLWDRIAPPNFDISGLLESAGR